MISDLSRRICVLFRFVFGDLENWTRNCLWREPGFLVYPDVLVLMLLLLLLLCYWDF